MKQLRSFFLCLMAVYRCCLGTRASLYFLVREVWVLSEGNSIVFNLSSRYVISGNRKVYFCEDGGLGGTIIVLIVPLPISLFLSLYILSLMIYCYLPLDLGPVLLQQVHLLRVHLHNLWQFELWHFLVRCRIGQSSKLNSAYSLQVALLASLIFKCSNCLFICTLFYFLSLSYSSFLSWKNIIFSIRLWA